MVNGLGIPFIFGHSKLSYPLLGSKLLTKVSAQITFNKDKATLTDQTGQPTLVLTL